MRGCWKQFEGLPSKSFRQVLIETFLLAERLLAPLTQAFCGASPVIYNEEKYFLSFIFSVTKLEVSLTNKVIYQFDDVYRYVSLKLQLLIKTWKLTR